MFQVVLGLKEIQKGPHVLKLNKVPLLLKTVNNNVLMYVAPKLALVPPSRYCCDVR